MEGSVEATLAAAVAAVAAAAVVVVVVVVVVMDAGMVVMRVSVSC